MSSSTGGNETLDGQPVSPEAAFEAADHPLSLSGVGDDLLLRNDLAKLGWWGLLVILVLAGYLRVDHLSDVSLSYDESCSWRISQYPMAEMFDAIRREAHPPLYYLCLKGWTKLFGNAPEVLRMLSVIFGLATVVSVWYLVVEFVQSAQDALPQRFDASWQTRASLLLAAGLAALLIALNALHVELSHEARPYTLGTFLAVLAATFLIRAQRSDRGMYAWFGFGLSTAALSMTHYYALWTVAMLFIYAFVALVCKRSNTGSAAVAGHWSSSVSGLLISLGMVVIVWSVWAEVFLFQHARAVDQLWFSSLTLRTFLDTTFQVVAGGKTSAIWESATGFALLIWCVVGSLMLLSRRSGDMLVGFCLLGPLLATLIYSMTVRNIVGVRYLLFGQTFLLIAAAMLVARQRSVMLRGLGAVSLICWSLFWSAEVRAHREFVSGFPGAIRVGEQLNQVAEESDDAALYVACNPFIFTMLTPYVDTEVDLRVVYQKNHSRDLLGGPSVQRRDFEQVVEAMNSLRWKRIWTVDAVGLFGQVHRVRVPRQYQLVSEQRFAERYGYRVDYIVREFQLDRNAK